MKPPATIRNHSQPPITILNYPQLSTTTQNNSQPPRTIHNHPKIVQKAKNFIVDTETDVDMDYDMKKWYIYMFVCIYILYKTLNLLFFFLLHWLFVFVNIQRNRLMLRAMSDIALKTFIFYFFELNFPLMSGGSKRLNLQQKACMTFCYCPTF